MQMNTMTNGMRRAIKPVSLLLVPSLLIFTTGYAFAGEDKIGFTSYFFSDSGENSVVTTSFNLAKRIFHKTAVLLDIELDHVTVPAVTAVTGATRPQRKINEPFEKSRGQVIFGVEQGLENDYTVAANMYRSQEVDYLSTAFIGTVSKELNEKNTTLTLRGQYNADLVGKIEANSSLTEHKKKVVTGALNLTQLLSATTVLDAGYDFVYLKGYLSDPYRQVTIIDGNGGSVTTDEMHPSRRTRQAVSGRLTQMIPTIKGSLIGGYRYYFDNWKVQSHTADLKFNKYVVNDVIFSVNYRYYTQSASYFTLSRYVGQEYLSTGYRTADYKLKAFSSNNFGISLEYLLRGIGKLNPDLDFLQNSSIEVNYFKYFNDLDFVANIVQFSLRVSI